MEVAIIIVLSMLAYICWNILAIKDSIEHTNAKLKNIEDKLDNVDTRLYDLRKNINNKSEIHIKKHFK